MRTQLTLFVDQAKIDMLAATQQYSHTKTCADSSCLECKLKKNFSSWHSILGLPSQLTEKFQIPKTSTWFSTRVYKGKWISACTLCKEFRSMVQKKSVRRTCLRRDAKDRILWQVPAATQLDSAAAAEAPSVVRAPHG
jgi:hypothetical protein